jgi:serine/threonine-protein kinase
MAATALREGDILAGKYRIDGVLGQGGMGLVFGAFHLELEQPVAVKVLHPEVAERGDAAARFRREARAAAKIKSEHVVRVLDVGTLDGGGAYMVMEYLEGNDLAEEMHRRGQLPIPETLDYMLQACEAVSEAHRAGIVHRDLKPANLFLSRRPDGSRVAKVLDFGISKSVVPGSSSDPSLTGTSTIMGSPLYMSPEQMRSARDVDARTDVWSLGTILFEAIAGSPPFAGESVPQICAALLNDPPAPMQTFRPDVAADLEKVIARCLAKDREERWASVGDLANALAPYAPATSRLHATRASRGKISTDASIPQADAHPASMTRDLGSPAVDTQDPPGTKPPASPTLASAPGEAPRSAATLNSWGTTGSGRRHASRVLWFAIGGALLAVAAIAVVTLLRRSPEAVGVPVEVLSSPAATPVPPPLPEIVSTPAPTTIASVAPSSHPVASTTPVAVHTAPAKSAAPKRDAANRPPVTKVDTISDFGGRR